MRWAVLACVLAAVALPLAGCGGGGGVTESPLAAAATATRSSETMRFSMSGTFTLAGHSAAFEGLGSADTGSGRSSMSLSSQAASTGQTDTDMVMDGSVLYIRSPELKRWVKFDFEKLGEDVGGGIDSMLMVGGRSNPIEVLAYLDAAGPVEVLGTERVRGVETTHYRGEVDFARYADVLEEDDEDAAKRIRNLVDEAGGRLIVPLDVWVDADDRVRRESYELSIANDFSMKTTMELYDFGVDVDVEVPEGDVTDLTDILEKPGG
jgi:hypothetical protein